MYWRGSDEESAETGLSLVSTTFLLQSEEYATFDLKDTLQLVVILNYYCTLN